MEQPPYPGVIIEEMLDSASMHGDQHCDGQVALMDQRHEVRLVQKTRNITYYNWRHQQQYEGLFKFNRNR